MSNTRIASFRVIAKGANCYLLRILGELDTSTRSLALDAVRAVPTDAEEIAIDLASVSFMNLGGLRSLIEAVAGARQRECRVWVEDPGPARRLTALAGLDDALAFGKRP